jgi:hypothetical protein
MATLAVSWSVLHVMQVLVNDCESQTMPGPQISKFKT